MKKIRTVAMLGLFLGTAVCNLFAQYMDVGDDPAKIEIASTKNIIYNGKPVGGYAWSHDGEWFLGANNDGGYIMDKNGNFLQKPPRRFNSNEVSIFNDNKRIFYKFEDINSKKDYYAIYDLQTKQETILSIDSEKEQYLDISPQGEILFMQVVVVSRKNTYKFVSFNPATGSRQELGVISGVRIYYVDFGNFRFFNKSNLLLLVSEQGARLKNYNFNMNKFTDIANHEVYFPTFCQLHDGRHIVVTVFSDTVYLYEKGGILLGKFRAFFDRGGPDQYGTNHDLIPGSNNSDRELAPNGKLALIRMEEVGEESGNPTQEFYMFNFKGKSVRFPMPCPIFSFEWSPQGDRLLNGNLLVFLRKIN